MVLGGVAPVDIFNIAQVPVVKIAPCYEPSGLVFEVKSPYHDRSCHTLVLVGSVRGDVVVETVAHISAESETQAPDGIIVDSERPGQFVRRLEFVRRGRTVMDPPRSRK